MHFGPQRARKCNTGRICHEFGRISLHSHPRLHLQSSVENVGRRGRRDGNFRLHIGGLLLGPSGALCCSVGAFGDTSQNSTPQCVHMGSGTTTFQDLVRKGVRRCCGASARVLCPGCGQRVRFVASTLVTSSVTTKVSKSREGRRESAHQRSLSRLETVPSLSSPLASLSPMMSLTPTVVDLGWFMSSGCKKCSWRREPSRGSILGNILHVMRRSGGGRMESPITPQ